MGLQPSRRARSHSSWDWSTQIDAAVKFMMASIARSKRPTPRWCEINPFITTTDGRLFALDAKMDFDDNALYRHKDLKELRDITEEDPLEVEATKYGLNYIKLDGNIALHGQRRGPGDGDHGHHQVRRRHRRQTSSTWAAAPTRSRVTHAFEILLSDKNVKAVLINIFGGILRVDTLANGVVEAAQRRTSSCRSCCDWKAPTSSRAARS